MEVDSGSIGLGGEVGVDDVRGRRGQQSHTASRERVESGAVDCDGRGWARRTGANPSKFQRRNNLVAKGALVRVSLPLRMPKSCLFTGTAPPRRTYEPARHEISCNIAISRNTNCTHRLAPLDFEPASRTCRSRHLIQRWVRRRCPTGMRPIARAGEDLA